MPPPPWKWQPTQLYWLYSVCPWLTAQAFPSYGLFSAAAPSCFGPGCKPLTRTGRVRRAESAEGVMSRVSRWQATRSSTIERRLNTRHPVSVEDGVDLGAAA